MIAAAQDARDGKVAVAFEPQAAPERIALLWKLGAAVTSGPLMDHPDYVQWVRQDLHAAVVAERDALAARVAMLEGALRDAVLWDGQDDEGVDAVWLARAEAALAKP